MALPPVDGKMASALERVIAFSDGIFAVAITLLVLVIAVPNLGNKATDSDLQARLLDAIPSVLGFVLSFAVVGAFWISHHRLFQVVHVLDRPTMYMNLLFLMTICFVPFPTGVIAQYGQLPTAIVFYAASMAFAGLTLALLCWVATMRQERGKVERRVGRYFAARSAGMASVFLISIPVAIKSVDVARYVWLAIPIIYVILGRSFRSDVSEELRPVI